MKARTTWSGRKGDTTRSSFGRATRETRNEKEKTFAPDGLGREEAESATYVSSAAEGLFVIERLRNGAKMGK